MKHIAGIFQNSADAFHAYDRLIKAGFEAEKVSLIVSPEGRDRVFTNVTTTEQGAKDAVKGSIAGAVGVGTLSALVGGLTALIIGPGVLAVGPLLIALSSGAAGAAIGSLSGALVEAGFSRDDATAYSEALENNKAVIVLHDTPDDREAIARDILRWEGATPGRAA